MALGDANLEALKEDYDKLKAEEEQSELGGDVKLAISLPNSKEQVYEFKLGHAVQYVKAVLNNEHGLPMSMVLTSGGATLIDPLSLSDCSTISPSKVNHVQVKV
ncbi:hypothetical protein WJX73_007510 [Symbiochloris irregularis]|uniref:Ubiquitin-like domain-containing protein n=1 Tax=Symbiochloris irregularis TaxID=706552 RepID=A0AAW1NQU3_9CHLO